MDLTAAPKDAGCKPFAVVVGIENKSRMWR